MDQSVILELRVDAGPSHSLENGGSDYAVIESWTITAEGWTTLAEVLGGSAMDIVAKRSVLATKSTYFRALFGDFREAKFDRVKVNWDITGFLYLQQFIFCENYNLLPSKVADLLESATFFGVDTAILAVEEWASSATASKDHRVIQATLQVLPFIWDTSCKVGNHLVSNLLLEFLAVNFVVAAALSSFLELSDALLSACIAHPQLTVESERQLCEALLSWYDKRAQTSESGKLVTNEFASTLSQIQRRLLSKRFLLGRLHESCPPAGSSSFIRITVHLEWLDLSGCDELTDRDLFTSAASASQRRAAEPAEPNRDVFVLMQEPNLRPNARQYLRPPSLYNFAASSPTWPRFPAFPKLKGLNLSQCWKISQDALVNWVKEACPNLVELTLMNCPQITVEILHVLNEACPILQVFDLSIDIEAVRYKDMQTSEPKKNFRWIPDCGGIIRVGPCSYPDLSRVSLRGRREISDYDLKFLAQCAPSLAEIDLSMCTSLLDFGISRFIKRYQSGLKTFRARGTEFGTMSSRALASCMPTDQGSTRDRDERPRSCTSQKISIWLDSLDLESCYGATAEDLASVLRAHSDVTHLSLADTNLTDSGLLSFNGTCLQQLDVRDTQVSGLALKSIFRANPHLEAVDVRGCKTACSENQDIVVADRSSGLLIMRDEISSGPVHFQELGIQHKLKELKVGWSFDDLALRSSRSSTILLKSFSLGIGGTISDPSFQSISEHSTYLEHLSLCFQVITEDGLIGFLEKPNRLRSLELRFCLMRLSSVGLTTIADRCPNLRRLKLERVAHGISDSDIIYLSKRCDKLYHLSLVGCQALTFVALQAIAKNWQGLTRLQLEECTGLNLQGAGCLLSCGALEILIFRHNGKGITKDFIDQALVHFPLLRHLSLDTCDSLENGFQRPTKVHPVLNTLLIARCMSQHSMSITGSSSTDIRTCHKDTLVIEYNAGQKTYKVKCRL